MGLEDSHGDLACPAAEQQSGGCRASWEGELEPLQRVGSPRPWGFMVRSGGLAQQQLSTTEPCTPTTEGWDRIREKVKLLG